ncbi:MAG: hypothetical protein ACLTX6_11845 [Lachnospiraceae bacterium]
MKELINQILNLWSNYWGDSLFSYLLILAAAYLLVFKRKEENVKYVLTYLLIMLFLFFCPLTAAVIQKCIGESVYWRVLWLIPSSPVIALAMTELIKDHQKNMQMLLVVLCIGIVAVSGKEVYLAGNYTRVHNYQQVPDEVAGICELIQADAQGEKFTFASDDDISSYVRVYDPSIYNLIGRNARSTHGRSRKLYYEINSPEPDYRIIATGGKNRSVIIWH